MSMISTLLTIWLTVSAVLIFMSVLLFSVETTDGGTVAENASASELRWRFIALLFWPVGCVYVTAKTVYDEIKRMVTLENEVVRNAKIVANKIITGDDDG